MGEDFGDRGGALKLLEIWGNFSIFWKNDLFLGGFSMCVRWVGGVFGTGELETGFWDREEFRITGK